MGTEKVVETVCRGTVVKGEEVEAGVPERIRKYKEKVLNTPLQTDIERMLWYTRVYKATESQPIGPCMRAAMAFRETLRNMSIRIEDEELIVGCWAGKRGGIPLGVEVFGPASREILMPLLFRNNPEKIKEAFQDGIGSLSAERLMELAKSLSDEEFRLLTTEIIPYWRERSVSALITRKFAEEGLLGEPIKIPDEFVEKYKFIWSAPYDMDCLVAVTPMQGHITIGTKKVLDLGFRGIARQAQERLEELRKSLPEDSEEFKKAKDFLEAVIVSAEAVCEFAERFAVLAEDLASKAGDERRRELLEVAKRIRRVPAEPPSTFVEALQAIWFTQVVMAIAYGGEMIIAPGRVDQYLYPYYKQDVESGRITPEKALELLMEYLIKVAQDIYFGPNNITIGGVDRNGNCAVNDVSYLFIEALKRLRGCGRAGLAVRVAPNTPRDFLLKAAEVYRVTGGVAFHNDTTIIRGLVADGYLIEDARDYSIVGYVEPTGSGNNNGYTSGQCIRLPSVLEAALNGGRLHILGWKQVGAETPTNFERFEDVLKAFEKQIEYAVDLCVRKSYIKDMIIAENYPVPILSATIEGCIESAKDFTSGGAKYNHSNVSAQGIATIANSLAAIKWAVFDKKLITMQELLSALRSNFKDSEEVRQILLKAPKYGNDDPYVDELALWAAKVLDREARKRMCWMGGPHRTCLISVSGTQILEGKLIGATPDGRLAYNPVAIGINPVDGTAKNGLTAVLKSAAVVSKANQSDGTSLTLNLNPATIKSSEGLEKFASLIEAAFELGCRMVQFNPLSKETLLDAQKHPEKYPDLVVKVSGYSFRFVDLPKVLQDEIIARFEYEA
ncbi:MAG: pyruvate formate lyase family protein [Candidatus Jordarchaeales archaeon]